MKKCKIGILLILLMLCVSLTGCNEWKNYFYSEASLSRVAEKALEEKYNEKFIIHKVWDKSQKTFFAVCSPESDEEVVFEITAWKDGSGLCHDEYLQGILSKEIVEKLLPKTKEVFGDCFIAARVFYIDTSYEKVTDVTLKDYINNVEEADGLLRVFVKESVATNSEVKKEYEFISNNLVNGIMQNMTCRIYFVDDKTMTSCKNYFRNNSYTRGSFDEIVMGCSYFGYGYNNGLINKTYDEYEKVRMEVMEDE